MTDLGFYLYGPCRPLYVDICAPVESGRYRNVLNTFPLHKTDFNYQMCRCNVIFKIADDGYDVQSLILFALNALNAERLISDSQFDL
jgi:hypothetical protein